MKKNYALYILLFFVTISFSQTTGKTCSLSEGRLDLAGFLVGNCNPDLRVNFRTTVLRVSEPLTNPPKGHTYYRYVIKIINAETNSVVETRTFKPNQYTANTSGYYAYSWVFKTNANINSYKAKIELMPYRAVQLNPDDPRNYYVAPLFGQSPTCTTSSFNRCITTTPQSPGDKPDLVLKDAIIFSGCTSCPSELSKMGSKRHIIGIQSMNLTSIRINNIGKFNASATRIGAYLSSDKTLSSNDKLIKTFYLGAINVNGFGTASGAIFRDDIDATSGSWYILLKVDDANLVAESNENNNVSSIGVTLTSVFGKPVNSLVQSVTNQPYMVDIFDLTGNKILSRKVNSVIEENEIIGTLPKNIYLVKSRNADRKVSFL